MRNIQDISQIVKVKNKNRFLRSFLTNILTSEVETVTPEVRSSLSDDTWGLLRGVKESYQCIPAVCIVSPSERWTWTSSDRTQVNVYLSPFLSSREFALRPGRKPPRLASPRLASPSQCFLASLRGDFSCWATGRLQRGQSKSRVSRNRKKHKTQMSLQLTPGQGGSGLKGSIWERMCVMNFKDCALSTINLFQKGQPWS